LQQNDITVRIRKRFLWCELLDVLTIPAGFHSFALRVKVQFVLGGGGCERYEENPMQDLFQNYVDDLSKLRDALHDELAVQARELSKAMGNYSERCEAVLASFMEKVSARGVEVEEAAAARFNAFRGLPVIARACLQLRRVAAQAR
jgi:hypothetical protein